MSLANKRSKFRILWHSVSSHVRCYDDKTEVLTKEGWKYFKDISFDDEILTLNPNSFILEYQKPYGIYIARYSGDMYRIKSKFVDLLVTPDHFFYVATRNRNNKWIWKFRQIKELKGIFKVPKTGKWIGIEQEYFILPGETERRIKMEDWLRFMGWYLSEGYIDHNPINGNYTVAIRNEQYKDEIFNILQRVTPNKVFYMDDDKVAVRDKQLWEYLKQFGYSLEKYVPDYIKNLSSRLIRIFLDSFFKGDGIKSNPGFSTSSVRLRDDLQELVIKSGCASDYMKIKDEGSPGNFGSSNAVNWRVSINTRYKYPQLRFSRHISIEKYNGMIYCVTVPNHIIMVRRNGKAVFSGNSGYGVVTRYITSGLAKAGYKVFVSAYYGLDPGGLIIINGVPHLPSKQGRFGRDSCLYFYKSLKANIACLMSDPWAFDWFPTELPNTMTYGPLDHINYPEEIQSLIRAYDFRVSPTYFQKNEWESYNPPVRYDRVIYHGVDTRIYYPRDKLACKRELGLSEDIFLFGTVAANSDKESRKSWGEIFQALRLFLDNNPDVKESHIKYFAFTNPTDPRGLNLYLFAKKYKLNNIVIFQNPMVFLTGIKDEGLATIYNAMDVQLYPSRREGFGIPILEGMACSTPAIAHDFSSMTELVKNRGWLVRTKAYVYTPINATSAIPDVEDLAKKIERAYFREKERKRYAKRSLAFARQYDWNKLVKEEWIPYFDQVMEQLSEKTLEERRIA